MVWSNWLNVVVWKGTAPNDDELKSEPNDCPKEEGKPELNSDPKEERTSELTGVVLLPVAPLEISLSDVSTFTVVDSMVVLTSSVE